MKNKGRIISHLLKATDAEETKVEGEAKTKADADAEGEAENKMHKWIRKFMNSDGENTFKTVREFEEKGINCKKTMALIMWNEFSLERKMS